MAGKFVLINGSIAHINLPDGKGSAVVNGRTYRWYFHDYCGSEFVDAHSVPLRRQPSPRHPVWAEFEKWLKKYRKARKTVPYTQTVEC
jgi:hypothetical protein